tara:strand:+ start:49 stop:873 length:825 start_codon:yes stop_codon:yes gene_type:complete
MTATESRFTNTVNGETIFTGNTDIYKGVKLHTGRGAFPESDIPNALQYHDYEYQQYLKVLDLIENQENPTMVELGSYWAFWSLVFRQRFLRGRNVLVEYSKRNLQIGLDNFALNDYSVDGVHGGFFLDDSNEFGSVIGAENIERCARPTIETLYYRDDGSKYTTTPIFWDNSLEGDMSGGEINFVEMCEEKEIETIDLLHMDIQGSELPLIKQLSETQFLQNVKVVMVATHSPSIHLECVSTLQNSNFKLLNIFPIEMMKLTGGDGMLVGVNNG